MRIGWKTLSVIAALAVLPMTARAMEDIGDILHQVDIMAKVLETKMKQALPGDIVEGGVFEPGGVRGFWVPGVGFVFNAKVNFPVAERKPEKGEEGKAPDLWDRIEQGEPPSGGAGSGGASGYYGGPGEAYGEKLLWDSMVAGAVGSEEARRKVKKLQSTLVETLADYGDRLTELGPDEAVIILISGSKPAPVATVPDYRTGVPNPYGESMEVLSFDRTESLPKIRRELSDVQRGLGDLLEQLEKNPDDAKLSDSVQQQRKRIEALVEQLESSPDPFLPHSGANIILRTTRYSGSEGGLPTTWVLKVRKGDLVDDTAELEKRVETTTY